MILNKNIIEVFGKPLDFSDKEIMKLKKNGIEVSGDFFEFILEQNHVENFPNDIDIGDCKKMFNEALATFERRNALGAALLHEEGLL